MLAVACDPPVLAAGDTYRADALLRRVPARAWQGVSAGQGAKGHRYDDWAFLRLDDGDPFPGGPAGQRWLLVRRNQRTGELACSHTAGRPIRSPWPPWSGWPDGAGASRCVNRSALIYANGLHDLGSRCWLVVVRRSSVGGCTSRAGGIGAGGARRADGGRRG